MTRYEAIEKALRIAECYALGRRNFMRNNASAYDQSVIRDVEADVEMIQAALALPEDSKTVNAELYGLAVEWADDAARFHIGCVCSPSYNYEFKSMVYDTSILRSGESDKELVQSALRYISLREASGEPMPYKVIREGDKVRFE